MTIREIAILATIAITYIIITWTKKFGEMPNWIKYTMGICGIILSIWALGARILMEVEYSIIEKFISPRT